MSAWLNPRTRELVTRIVMSDGTIEDERNVCTEFGWKALLKDGDWTIKDE